MRGMKRQGFILPTVLIGVALLSIPVCWVAFQLNLIHQRHELLAKHTASQADYDALRAKPHGFKSMHTWIGNVQRKSPKHPPDFLWLFGEAPKDTVNLVVHVNKVPPGPFGFDFIHFGPQPQMEECIPKEERESAEQLFPEADIRFMIYDFE
jgi:hypothetical protein